MSEDKIIDSIIKAKAVLLKEQWWHKLYNPYPGTREKENELNIQLLF